MPLKMDNYLSFAIVNGFFIGLLLSFIKFDDPVMIVAWTLISTIGLYLIFTACVSMFVRFMKTADSVSRKAIYNRTLEEYIEEFDKREKSTNKIRGFIRTMEKTMRDEEETEVIRGKAQKQPRGNL